MIVQDQIVHPIDELVPLEDLNVAVIIPCYNEALTVSKVIRDFKTILPYAEVYVYDNNSSDATSSVAHDAGATVRREQRQGKGNVVRRMFADVEADIYVLVDGDDTYDAPSSKLMIQSLAAQSLDMVNGARDHTTNDAYRAGHQFGNRFLTSLVRLSFGTEFRDMLSGYRVFSRRFVKSFPGLSDGFEIETELTVHALRLRLPVAEITTPYYARPAGSFSKLNTIRDGIKILRIIGRIIRDEKPLQFFGIVSSALCVLSFSLSLPVFLEYLETGLVLRFPTLFVAVGLLTMSVVSAAIGLILDTLGRVRMELRRLAYQAISGGRLR